MAGLVDIKVLLKDMRPVLGVEEYVFCTVETFKIDEKIIELQPICTFLEEEGMTLIISKTKADKHRLSYEGIFNKITLKIHSSLEAVGLTAAFSNALKDAGISANVVAGYYHDYIFVPKEKATLALTALRKLSE